MHYMCVVGGARGLGSSWEKPNGIPLADISWIKEDTERRLFTPVQTCKNITGLCKRRCVIKLAHMSPT